MTTRNLPVPNYVDLAKAGAAIQRELAPAACVRLQAAVERLNSVRADLRFAMDERGRVRVSGRAVAEAELACQSCTLPVSRRLEVEVSGLLARSEQDADAWRAQDAAQTIIVVTGTELNELELVEDELLLGLPTRVCVDAECEQRPPMIYAPSLDEQGSQPSPNPFGALAELRGKGLAGGNRGHDEDLTNEKPQNRK